ncbi:MAG: 30S ribosomal protein S16 [Deltaproteobacteria bacterium]
MVKIRLTRAGSKGKPFYRIVAADSRAPRDGKFLEILGFYDPRTSPHTLEVKTDRVNDWISHGAQPSGRVGRLLTKLTQN